MEPVYDSYVDSPALVSDVVEPVATLKSVDAKITQIKQGLATLTNESSYAKCTLFDRSPYYKTKGFAAVDECKKAFRLIGSTMCEDRSSLYTEVVEVTTRPDLDSRLNALQECELKTITWQRTVELLWGMKESRYEELYPIMREQVARLDALVLSQDDINARVDALVDVLTRCTKAAGDYLARDVVIELYKLVDVTALKILEQIQDQVLLENRKEEIIATLEGQKRAVETAVSAARGEMQTIFYQKLWTPGVIGDEATQALNRLKGDAGDLYFWKNAPRGSWAGYKIGYTPQTGAHGLMLEEEVAKRIAALSALLHKKLIKICKAEVRPEKQERLQQRLDECQHYFKKLEEDLETHFETLFTLPHDGLFETVRNYAFSLRVALSEVARMLAVVKTLSQPYPIAVYKAQKVMKAYLVPQVVALNVDGASFNDACLLFDVGMSIREMKERKEQEFRPLVYEASEYATRIHNMVLQAFAKHAPASLALTDDEKLVWDIVLKHEPFDALYYKNESRELLPKRLQTTVIKLATRALFVSKQGEVNSRLELLLSVLKTHDAYLPTCQAVAQFRTIIGEYDSWHAAFRRDQQLKNAYEVLAAIFEAEREQTDVLVYSKIVQRCIEFARADVVNEGAAEAEVQKRRNSLSKLLFERLDALAQGRAYVRFYHKFIDKPLDFWVTELDEGYTVLTEIDMHARENKNLLPGENNEDCKKRLLEGFVLRLLVACLYEKDVREQAAAQQHIYNILELSGYADYRHGFSDYIKQILFENTINKILGGKLDIGPNELKAFIEGPVSEFMQYDRVSFSCNKLQHALYVLILKEQVSPKEKQLLTNMFKQTKGDQAFTKWFSDYRVFMVSSLSSNLFGRALQEHTDVLSSHVGADEALKLKQIAEQVRLYTMQLVK